LAVSSQKHDKNSCFDLFLSLDIHLGEKKNFLQFSEHLFGRNCFKDGLFSDILNTAKQKKCSIRKEKRKLKGRFYERY